jgi:hypothetical protein
MKAMKFKYSIIIALLLCVQTGISAQTDTVYHYFSNGQISVVVAPASERQMIWVYNLKGEQIQVFENVRMSYSVSNNLIFRENGALEKVMSHTNPGASMFWYETETYFDSDNEPRYKISRQKPFRSAIESMGDKYLWNRSTGEWVKQEIVICQPHPGH